MKFIPLIFLLGFSSNLHSQVICSIGEKDNNINEFALAPDNYKDYAAKDFGYEDNRFIIDLSNPSKDWPYILPGPADAWAGSGGLAGIRTQFNTILFNLSGIDTATKYKLTIGFNDTHSKAPPLLKVIVNDSAFVQQLNTGGSDSSLQGNFSAAKPSVIEIDLPSALLKETGNEIIITSLEGSWAIFDFIELQGPGTSVLTSEEIFVRSVKNAGYTINGIPQLLIDAEHLSGEPELLVEINGKPSFKQKLEKGRYIFEIPAEKESNYLISTNGKLLATGKIMTKADHEGKPTDYVNTSMGSAHSRWMIAPLPAQRLKKRLFILAKDMAGEKHLQSLQKTLLSKINMCSRQC